MHNWSVSRPFEMRQRERLRAPSQGRPDVVVTTLSLSHTLFGRSYYCSVTVPFDVCAEDEPDKVLYVAKVVGLAVLLLGAGVLVYLAGKRRPVPAPRRTGEA